MMCFHSLAVMGNIIGLQGCTYTEDLCLPLKGWGQTAHKHQSSVGSTKLKKKKKTEKERKDQAVFPKELCKLAGTLLIALQML